MDQTSDTQRRLARNGPCFCGSGKKYKRCCGASEKHAKAVGSRPETSSPVPPLFHPLRADPPGRDLHLRHDLRLPQKHRGKRRSRASPGNSGALAVRPDKRPALAPDPPALARRPTAAGFFGDSRRESVTDVESQTAHRIDGDVGARAQLFLPPRPQQS